MRIRQRFWWPTIWRDVADYVKTCDICQRYGPKDHRNPLQPYQPVFPFEFIFLDLIVNLPRTPRQNRHIITMTEGLTKWCEAKALRDATSINTAKFLLNDIIHRYGVPSVVVTDNGSHFKGDFHELCVKMGIRHRYATIYHPQTAGQDERTNGLLLGRIRKWRMKEYNKWDEDLPASIFACNTRKISSTKFSAMETLMGYTAGTASSLKHIKMTKTDLMERLALVTADESELVSSRLRLMESIRDEAVRAKDEKAAKMKERYDRRVRADEMDIGDEVLLYDSTLLKQWSRKLEGHTRRVLDYRRSWWNEANLGRPVETLLPPQVGSTRWDLLGRTSGGYCTGVTSHLYQHPRMLFPLSFPYHFSLIFCVHPIFCIRPIPTPIPLDCRISSCT